jgi:hypothetical protein
VTPAAIFCTQQRRLLEEFVAAVSGYLSLESAKRAAAVRGGESVFAAELEAARERKDAAKEAIIAHQREHGY